MTEQLVKHIHIDTVPDPTKTIVKAYPMEKKLDFHEPLDKFVRDSGAPDSMIYNGSQEQVGPGTKFQAKLIEYVIHDHISEKERSIQNPAEGVIQELRKKWYW